VQVDYIVVGAGSAGCVLAERLSASGRHSVLLLEAGSAERSFWIEMPLGYGRSYYDPRVNWMFRSEPEPALGGRSVYVPRGKAFGGSGAINAMVWVRGLPGDFDGWAAEGCAGWGWEAVRAAFRRIEDHGRGGGPVTITSSAPHVHPTARAFVAGARELGFPPLAGPDDDTIEGVGHYRFNIRGGRRMSAARAFLRPARGRPNLTVFGGAEATGLLFEGARCTGVTWDSGGGATGRAFAGREVILAAGAIGSPKLLELSGIGDPAVLAAAGVPVRHALPAVGGWLQDHPCYDHYYRARVPTLNATLGAFAGQAMAGVEWALLGGGPLSVSLNHAGGFVRTLGGTGDPDMQLYFAPLTFSALGAGKRDHFRPDPWDGMSASASPCRPTSRGSCHIVSPDPKAAPAIRLNLLATEADRAAMRRGARLLRRIAAAPAFARVLAREDEPGPEVESDAALDADIRARSYSVYHPCGTVRMGGDPATSALDPRLRVRGVGGLRVIDASAFPAVTSGNINAPSMMVGLRGAELALEDAAG
jgi:choline dehydrogenase